MIKRYLKDNISVFLILIFSILVFNCIGILARRNYIDLIYSTMVVLFISGIYIINDYLKFFNKIKYLQQIYKNLSIYKCNFPQINNSIEEQYIEILDKLYENIEEKLSEVDNKNNENLEYYTMWVHQIKTPIAGMKLIMQSMDDNYQKNILEQELFKIEQYVELALQFLKIGNLETDLVIGKYNLEDIIRQSVKKYSVLFINKGLYVNINDCNKMILTDSKWFSFILEQIISNAIKYTNKGGIEFFSKEDEKSITLYIKDCGIGIKSEDIYRIFEKGYTGFNGRVNKNASGIGLYLTKKVCSALNHYIQINSEINKGTTVSLKIKK